MAGPIAEKQQRRFGVPPAFRYPKYRAYWLGFLLSVSGHQVFQFVQFVLVHELTGSVVALGFLGVANAVPAITLGVVGGVFADRWNKRRLIIFTQASAGVAVLTLAVLVATRNIEVWHVATGALIVSGVGAFDGPARSAYYPRLIHPSAMISAVALNSTIWQSTRIVGPALAGVIVASANDALDGIAIALFIASFGAVAMVIVMLRLNVEAAGESKGNPLRSLMEGLEYIRGNTIVAALLLLSFAVAFLGWAFVILMPVFAIDILGVGTDGQGLLLASAGVGATGITVLLAVVDTPLLRRRGLFVIGGAVSFGILLIGYSLTAEFVGSFALALAFMFGLGVTQMVYTTGTMGSIQLSIPDHVRGRVLGIYGIVWGMQPLSGTQAAFLAGFIGVSGAVAVGGGAIVAVALVAAITVPSLRTLRIQPRTEDQPPR